tara:strand:+ start:399 stop:815 length:417 start_codon:yes stop_codon:yes gene_type:complete
LEIHLTRRVIIVNPHSRVAQPHPYCDGYGNAATSYEQLASKASYAPPPSKLHEEGDPTQLLGGVEPAAGNGGPAHHHRARQRVALERFSYRANRLSRRDRRLHDEHVVSRDLGAIYPPRQLFGLADYLQLVAYLARRP